MNKTTDYVVKELLKFRPKAIALWGSYGMGLSDKYTHDVDVVIFIDDFPKKDIKQKIFDKISDKSVKLPFNGDFLIVDGIIYEIRFIFCREAEKAVIGIKKGDDSKENFVAVFLKNTKTLYDRGWLENQLKAIRTYPNKLLESNIRLNLYMSLKQYDYFERELKRRKPIYAEYTINEAVHNLIRVIYALNKHYYGKSKWVESEMKNFKIKTADFEMKILKILKTRDIELYRKLSMQVFSLCKRKYPKLSEEIYTSYKNSMNYDKQIEAKNESKQ
jgi:hypothetical protein